LTADSGRGLIIAAETSFVDFGCAMFGFPSWLLAIIVALVILAGVPLWFYSRYKAMCRTVRDELSNFLKSNYPDGQLCWQPLGNLEIQTPNGGHRVIDMANVYVAVGRLPGMGRDPAARARL
jgi:hypothetical protein